MNNRSVDVFKSLKITDRPVRQMRAKRTWRGPPPLGGVRLSCRMWGFYRVAFEVDPDRESDLRQRSPLMRWTATNAHVH